LRAMRWRDLIELTSKPTKTLPKSILKNLKCLPL
jgi:hypothetical protein